MLTTATFRLEATGHGPAGPGTDRRPRGRRSGESTIIGQTTSLWLLSTGAGGEPRELDRPLLLRHLALPGDLLLDVSGDED